MAGVAGLGAGFFAAPAAGVVPVAGLVADGDAGAAFCGVPRLAPKGRARTWGTVAVSFGTVGISGFDAPDFGVVTPDATGEDFGFT